MWEGGPINTNKALFLPSVEPRGLGEVITLRMKKALPRSSNSKVHVSFCLELSLKARLPKRKMEKLSTRREIPERILILGPGPACSCGWRRSLQESILPVPWQKKPEQKVSPALCAGQPPFCCQHATSARNSEHWLPWIPPKSLRLQGFRIHTLGENSSLNKAQAW